MNEEGNLAFDLLQWHADHRKIFFRHEKCIRCVQNPQKKRSKKTCFGIKKCLGKFYLDKDKFLFEKKKMFCLDRWKWKNF